MFERVICDETLSLVQDNKGIKCERKDVGFWGVLLTGYVAFNIEFLYILYFIGAPYVVFKLHIVYLLF